MRPMQHRFHQVMDEIRDNKAAYILGGFFILAGLIAGFVSAGKEAPSFRFAVLRMFWGYQTDYQFLSFLWNIGFWRILGWAAYLFFSLWIIGIPWMCILVPLYSALWSMGWGILFSIAFPLQFLWMAPIFLILLGIHSACFLQLCAYGIDNVKKCLRERQIPKTPSDIYREAAPHYRRCLACYLVLLGGLMLEAILLPNFYQALL